MIKNRSSSVIRRYVHLALGFVLFGEGCMHMLTPATLADQGKRGIFAGAFPRIYQAGWSLMCGSSPRSPEHALLASNYTRVP